MERIPTEIDLCLFTSITVQKLKLNLQNLYIYIYRIYTSVGETGKSFHDADKLIHASIQLIPDVTTTMFYYSDAVTTHLRASIL